VDENNCSTATSDNAATVSLLNVSLVDPPLGVSVINPADRKA
jgi:hypothetical protein